MPPPNNNSYDAISDQRVMESEQILFELVTAINSAYFSSWQSTAAWSKQLEDARLYLEMNEIAYKLGELE